MNESYKFVDMGIFRKTALTLADVLIVPSLHNNHFLIILINKKETDLRVTC